MEKDCWYFAYGSNLCIEQMQSRTGSIHDAKVAALIGYRLAFNKQGSGKEIYASILPQADRIVWGVIYRCKPLAMEKLDVWEGVPKGHYRRQTVTVVTQAGERIEAIAYVAEPNHICHEGRPTDAYLSRILTGARHHQLPEEYVRWIESLAQLTPLMPPVIEGGCQRVPSS